MRTWQPDPGVCADDLEDVEHVAAGDDYASLALTFAWPLLLIAAFVLDVDLTIRVAMIAVVLIGATVLLAHATESHSQTESH